MRLAASLLSLLVLACSPAGAQGAQDAPGGFANVYLADGTTVPLRGWSLSYDVQSWMRGTARALATSDTRRSRELWVDKKTYTVVGATLELLRKGERVEKLALVPASGKRSELDADPPHRDLLLPDSDKKLLVQPQSLDLSGETLTGTRRSFCLMSYTSLVSCGTTPAHRVLRVEFAE